MQVTTCWQAAIQGNLDACEQFHKSHQCLCTTYTSIVNGSYPCFLFNMNRYNTQDQYLRLKHYGSLILYNAEEAFSNSNIMHTHKESRINILTYFLKEISLSSTLKHSLFATYYVQHTELLQLLLQHQIYHLHWNYIAEFAIRTCSRTMLSLCMESINEYTALYPDHSDNIYNEFYEQVLSECFILGDVDMLKYSLQLLLKQKNSTLYIQNYLAKINTMTCSKLQGLFWVYLVDCPSRLRCFRFMIDNRLILPNKHSVLYDIVMYPQKIKSAYVSNINVKRPRENPATQQPSKRQKTNNKLIPFSFEIPVQNVLQPDDKQKIQQQLDDWVQLLNDNEQKRCLYQSFPDFYHDMIVFEEGTFRVMPSYKSQLDDSLYLNDCNSHLFNKTFIL